MPPARAGLTVIAAWRTAAAVGFIVARGLMVAIAAAAGFSPDAVRTVVAVGFDVCATVFTVA